jgi:hypothetical protein
MSGGRYTKKIPPYVYFVGEDGNWIQGPYVNPPKRDDYRKFKVFEISSHMGVEIVKADDQFIDLVFNSIITKLETEDKLITEAIGDIIVIAKLNDYETAIELIKKQFIVIDKQDIHNGK